MSRELLGFQLPDSCKDASCGQKCRVSFNEALRGIAYFHRENGVANSVDTVKNYVCIQHEDCLRSHDLGRVCFGKSEFANLAGKSEFTALIKSGMGQG